MAGSPQIEDGYTRVANELMEQVPRYRFNGTQLRIIIVIWRFTYGFKRKQHAFSLSFLAEATNASRSQVDRELTSLIDRNVVKVINEAVGGRPRILAFNKNYEEWSNERCPRNGVQESSVLQNEDEVSSALGTRVSSKWSTKKEKKKTINKGVSGMGVYKEIIDYLNAKANKRFSHHSKANQRLISGRISEGRTVEDFKYVIDTKCSHWLSDKKMNEYLRPSTLFSQTNFENYLNQSPKSGDYEPAADPEIEARNRQIEYDNALREWVMAGNDPDEFRFDG